MDHVEQDDLLCAFVSEEQTWTSGGIPFDLGDRAEHVRHG